MQNIIVDQYNALLSSIDFFSQNLNLQQIIEYGFKIYNSFEKPKASAIYVLDDSKTNYEVAFSNGYNVPLPSVVKTNQHAMFAVRNGFILTDIKVQQRYFDDNFIEETHLNKIMPLIIDDQLFGFIISTDTSVEELDNTYDHDFFNRFNYLMNLSLEKASRYIERNELKKEIDKHIFNLDSISQTMKMILSELSVNGIIHLSTDVIRELTSSSVTAIALYDDIEDQIRIKSYEDVVNGHKFLEHFHLKPSYPTHKSICKMPEDYVFLESIFEDASHFKSYPVDYVILIIKENIIGFVTIGSPLAFEKYSMDILMRIQDITSIMYIALTNAKQFELITFQKHQLDRQIKVLENMNRIIKTISSADSVEELSELVMTTLNASFGIGKALFISLDNQKETVLGSYNIDTSKLDDDFFGIIRMQLDEHPVVYYTIDDYVQAFGNTFSNNLEGVNCFVLMPLFLNGARIEPFAYLLITEARDRLHLTQVNMLNILANSISPLLHQLLITSRLNTEYLLNPVFAIHEKIKKYQADYDHYGISFKIYIKKVQSVPFKEYEPDTFETLDSIIYNTYLFVFSNVDLTDYDFDYITDDNPKYESVTQLF